MQALYPTPKTQTERDQIDAARKARQKKQLPKVPWLLIPLLGGGVFWLTMEFMRITPEMWQSGSTAFIFFTFAMWLGVAGFAIAWASYSSRALYAHGKPLRTFWLGFIGIAMAMFGFQALFSSTLVATGVYAGLLFVWSVIFFVFGRDASKK